MMNVHLDEEEVTEEILEDAYEKATLAAEVGGPGWTWCSGAYCGALAGDGDGARQGWDKDDEAPWVCDTCGGHFCSQCCCGYEPGQGYVHKIICT